MHIHSQEMARVCAGPRQSVGLEIEIRDLVRHFGTRRVLQGLDLTIRPGEFIAIVGRSGCGKSTLLRLLAGLDAADEGSIALAAAAPEASRDDARIMFQDARLLPWRTVIQNVALGLKGERSVVRDQALTALAQVGLFDRANEWPSRLSGGQRQRVALARALVHCPRLLLLDEPLGALDALTRIEMQRLIESIWHQHGFTVVLVTHDVSEAVALADRVMLIESGQLTLDEPVPLPRPRERGSAAFAALEDRILRRLTTVEAVDARNRIRGRVRAIIHGRPLSEVQIETPAGIVTATLSSRELFETPLEIGAEVLAFFKSNELLLAI